MLSVRDGRVHVGLQVLHVLLMCGVWDAAALLLHACSEPVGECWDRGGRRKSLRIDDLEKENL